MDHPLLTSMAGFAAEMCAIRRDLHRHPELGFKEQRTAAIVADQLRRWGIPVHEGIGQTGVVGVIDAGNSTRAIGLRADMDALPIQENSDASHASVHEGVAQQLRPRRPHGDVALCGPLSLRDTSLQRSCAFDLPTGGGRAGRCQSDDSRRSVRSISLQ